MNNLKWDLHYINGLSAQIIFLCCNNDLRSLISKMSIHRQLLAGSEGKVVFSLQQALEIVYNQK